MEAYLNKQNKRVHWGQEPVVKCDTPKDKSSNMETSNTMCSIYDDKQDNESSGSNSDWDHDPDVELRLEVSDKDENHKREERADNDDKIINNDDSRIVNDIWTGKIFRKRINPSPIIAPVKTKVPKESKNQLDKVKTSKQETGALSDSETDIDNTEEDEVEEDCKNKGNVDKRDEIMKNKECVHEDANFSLEKEKLEIEKRKLDLEVTKFEYKKSILNKIVNMISEI